jgi:hypothetical protein
MPESATKHDKRSAESPSESAAASWSSPEPVYHQFEEIYARYAASLNNAWTRAQDQLRDINRDYLMSLHGVQAEVHKQVQEAFQRLMELRAEANGKDNAMELLAVAGREYATALNAANLSCWKRSEDIDRNHRDAMEGAREAYYKSNETSYQSFLNDVRKAWAGVDVASMDVNNLNLISRVMLGASQTARMAPLPHLIRA